MASETAHISDIYSCLKTFTSVYDDGLNVIERAAASRLESSDSQVIQRFKDRICRSVEVVKDAYKEGRDQHGPRFTAGDQPALLQLQHITIELQSRVLQEYRDLSYGHSRADQPELTEMMEYSGAEVVEVLAEWGKRFLQTESSQDTDSAQQEAALYALTGASHIQDFSPTHRRTWTREYNSSREESPNGGTPDEESGSRRHRKGSLLGLLKHRHRRESSSGRNSRQPSDAGLADNGSVQPVGGNGSTPSKEQDANLARASIPPNASISAVVSSLNALQVPDSPSVARSSNSLSIPHPTPDNNFLGFCEGAWRLWTGDRKGMKEGKEAVDGRLSGRVSYLTCCQSKCVFASHLDVDRVWTEVWELEACGLKFRWPFLAKSHVMQKKRTVNPVYIFQCMFCAFLGSDLQHFVGEDQYLSHIATEHRGRVMSEIVLYKLGCVNDRVCDDGEDFDINLYPLSAEEETTLRRRLEKEGQSEESLISHDGMPTLGRHMTNEHEPWNVGLSEFHIDDMELANRVRSHEY